MAVRDRDDPSGIVNKIFARKPFLSWHLTMPSPRKLAEFGPVVFAWVADGDSPAGPVPNGDLFGAFILDTAASGTAISTEVSDMLKLPVVGEGLAVAASGPTKHSRYRVRITFQMFSRRDSPVFVSRTGETGSATGMENLLAGLVSPDPDESRLIPLGILGRDVLQFMTVIYDGPSGCVEFRVSDDNMKGLTEEK